MSREAFDVIVIGGGPAGISAAIWCSDLGLRTGIIEQQQQFGGQLLKIHGPVCNYPGLEMENGRQLSERFVNHLSRFHLVQFVGDAVEAVDLTANRVRLASGMSLRAHTFVIATGVRRRKLNVPGEEEFVGRGILDSGVGEKDSVAGKRVLIVGGGDAALENANILAPVAREVTIVHRRDSFTARDEFVESLKHFQNVRIAFDSTVKEILGAAAVEAVVLEGREAGEVKVDAVLIRIGVVPNSELVAGQVELDDNGYIRADNEGRTSISRVFAAGDVANPIAPTICTAVGTGASAAKSLAATSEGSFKDATAFGARKIEYHP